MSFAQYLKVFLKKEAPLFEATSAPSKKDPALDFGKIEAEITSKVGGKVEEDLDKKTSFEALEQVLESIPLDYLEDPNNAHLGEIVELLVDPARFPFLEKYIARENEAARKVVSEIEKIDGTRDPITFNAKLQNYITISERLLKIHRLLTGQVSTAVSESVNLDDETKEKLRKLISELEKTIRECTGKFNQTATTSVERLPDSPEGEDQFYKYKDLLQMTGLIELFRDLLDKKEEKIKTKDLSKSQSDIVLKKKKRVLDRLINAIKFANLPSITNGEADTAGDHFKLFTELEKINKAWMDEALKNYVFNNDLAKYSEFDSDARKKESALEKDQLTYLRANRSWIRSYIESSTTFLKNKEGQPLHLDKDGNPLTAEFNEKESNALKTALLNTVTEKEKEIKNYYLSRDFNLGNFAGVQIKPEIRLPLYKKVKLPITEEDIKKESPLRGILSGMGKIVNSLFSAIPDKMDPVVAKAASQRNKAILSGLNSIVKGTVGLVGGKQAARDYDEKITSKISGKKEKGVKEDMLSLADSSGAMVVNPESPGQTLQTPSSLPGNNMDMFALAGPLTKTKGTTKKKKKSKAKKEPKVQSRVASFADFMQRK